MSLRSQPLPPVPEDTARIAQAAFRRGTPYMLLRDRLGALFADADFADLYPKLGQPAYAPWRLALVTLMQFREGLSDRRAADAVRGRIDWKYLLALELADAGFDFSVLCEFRARLLEHEAGERLLTRLLDVARDGGLLKARGRQRTDSTHVLAAIRTLNRLELLAETLRAALNAVATAEPAWLSSIAPADWHERYDRRVEDADLPGPGPKRDALIAQVAADGFRLLDALDTPDAPQSARGPAAVAVLRRVWARHCVRDGSGSQGDPTSKVRLRPLQNRGPGDRIQSPYDAEARYRTKRNTGWIGYMVHLTETCDAGAPHLIVHADTTAATVHEVRRVEAIHAALAAKGLIPSEHLADAAYISAAQLAAARERYGITLIGPPRPQSTWQYKTAGGFTNADFAVDWDDHVVRCPAGHRSSAWHEFTRRYHGEARGRRIRVCFDAALCAPCPSRTLCTSAHAQGRQLTLHPRAEHEALAAVRVRQAGETGHLYAQRRGIEGTIAQAVGAFGLRRCRYRGLARAALQSLATAAALNLDRLAAWVARRPLAPTRTSRFAALAA
ncbi:transposase [Methylobacterium radiotolerans]|nr:transposase [Methylobacterium radiotolerans]KTS49540.1 transposase [Methylobacterium radiotolerans]